MNSREWKRSLLFDWTTEVAGYNFIIVETSSADENIKITSRVIETNVGTKKILRDVYL